MKRMYVWETSEGKWFMYRTKHNGRLEGTVQRKGQLYTLDPRRMRIMHQKRKGLMKYLPGRGKTFQVQFWVEGQATPLDFLSPDVEKGGSSDALARIAKSKRIASLLSSERDMTQMLLLLSIVGNFALAAILYMAIR